jgi:hypothetical protein
VSREAGDRGSAGGCAAPTFGAHGPEGIRIGEYPAFHCDEAADSVKSGAGHLTGHRASAAREGWIRSGRGFIFLIPCLLRDSSRARSNCSMRPFRWADASERIGAARRAMRTLAALSQNGRAGSALSRSRRFEKEFEAYLRCGRLEHGCMRHIRVPHPFGATLRSWQFGSPAELSCVCAVSPATSSACWPSVASAEDFARVAAPAG